MHTYIDSEMKVKSAKLKMQCSIIMGENDRKCYILFIFFIEKVFFFFKKSIYKISICFVLCNKVLFFSFSYSNLHLYYLKIKTN